MSRPWNSCLWLLPGSRFSYGRSSLVRLLLSLCFASIPVAIRWFLISKCRFDVRWSKNFIIIVCILWHLDEYPLARCPDRTETILFGAARSSVISFSKYFPADDLETFLLRTGDLHPISYQNIIQTIWRPRKIRSLCWDFCSSKEIFFFLKLEPCIVVLDAVTILVSRVSILK